MDKAIARHVARVAFQASADIGNLIPLLKENCPADEYEKFRKAIASASAAIGIDVINAVFQDFPDLKREFEESIKVYGRVL